MKITFSNTHNAFQVIAPKGTLISLSATPTALADGVYVIGDEGVINIDDQQLTDSIYLSTAGSDYTVANGQRVAYPLGDDSVIIRAGGSAIPFKKKAKGGDIIEVESLEATENKTYAAPTGKAYSPVVVNVPAVPPVIQQLTATSEGTYTAPSGVDGYSPVIVDMSYHLPSEYEQLEYIICPSFSAQAGFSIAESIPNNTIFDFTTALTESTNSEIAFGGYSTGNTYELYYKNMQGTLYGAINDLNGFAGKSIQINTPYRMIARANTPYNLNGINIGYYRLNDYKFKGIIYHAKIYNFVNVGVGDKENVLYEFYPAKRKSDNKIGMYERVNDVFYSSTTGTEFEAPSV